jgi:hypothetical protein
LLAAPCDDATIAFIAGPPAWPRKRRQIGLGRRAGRLRPEAMLRLRVAALLAPEPAQAACPPPPPPPCCVDLGPRSGATNEADSAAFGHPGLLFDDAFMRRLGRKLASLPRLRAVATLRPFPPDACAWLAAAGFEELHPLATSEPTSPGRHLSGGEGGEGEGGGGRGGGGEAGSGEEHEHEHELACTWGPARVHVYVRPPPDPFPIGC